MGISTLSPIASRDPRIGTARAVFLDRDGVLNHPVMRNGQPYPPAGVEDLRIDPQAYACCAEWKAMGFRLIVVTNQPDVARGSQSRATVDAVHAALREALPLDEIIVCCHDDADGCDCRKPRPGMLLDAAARYDVQLAGSYFVGDRWRDIDAGATAGVHDNIWIDRGYREQAPQAPPAARVSSLAEAAAYIRAREVERRAVAEPSRLKVKLFADGADLQAILALASNPVIQGFTTNPTLMRKAGITNYEAFSRELLAAIPDRPVSLEVFADEFSEMERQARKIASWGRNVYVKLPVTNTRGESAAPLAGRLSHEGVQINFTALLTLDQVKEAVDVLAGGAPSYISVFAGRIADTGRDPVPLMAEAVRLMSPHPGMELIWASPRELLNLYQAEAVGCHILTATTDVLKKLSLVGKDLQAYSLETVAMFHADASASGFVIE